MDRVTYDSKDGIATMLDTYEHLYALFRARHEAGYDRGERLNEFVILGRFSVDTCGNWWTMQFDQPLPQTFADSLPPVMTRAEFHAALDTLEPDARRYSTGTSTGPLGSLPPPQMTCARCGKAGWTIENCQEFEAENGIEEILPLEPFVGKTLTEAQEALCTRTDGIYSLHASVRNDRWIDTSPDAQDSGREHGWHSHQDDDDPIGMDYVIVPGDETTPLVLRFYHASCREQLRGEEQTTQKAETVEAFTQMFSGAGFTGVRVEEIPLPKHILDWIMAEDSDATDEAISREMTYLRVTTNQGRLGIFMAAYPTIDLTDSGVKIAELVPEMADMPPDMPQLCGFDGNPATLLKLWQLFVKQMVGVAPNRSRIMARVISVVDAPDGWGARATLSVEKIDDIPGEANFCRGLTGTEIEAFAAPPLVAELRANPRFTGFITANRNGYRINS